MSLYLEKDQKIKLNESMKELDQKYERLEKLHKLYREGKSNTPEYKELELELKDYFKTNEEYRIKHKSNKIKRCKCKK